MNAKCTYCGDSFDAVKAEGWDGYCSDACRVMDETEGAHETAIDDAIDFARDEPEAAYA
jgi:endogenous inhibitor of DNA gyrase (YacG/DUF329 family)